MDNLHGYFELFNVYGFTRPEEGSGFELVNEEDLTYVNNVELIMNERNEIQQFCLFDNKTNPILVYNCGQHTPKTTGLSFTLM